jgi:hypothetical protein
VEKTVDYYMGLPYTVELEFGGVEYRASVKELPGCKATVKASESVEELWRRLKEDQRKRIEELLEFGDEVPEPAGVTVDPFWKSFPGGLEEPEAKTMLYRDGAAFFPLRILIGLWLEELADTKLTEVESSGTPPKGGTHHLDQTIHAREGELRPVRLGKSLKGAWVKLDGPRTEYGYKDIKVLEQPLRAEAGLVSALTILEGSTIAEFDFEKLREALLRHVETHPELKDEGLHEVLERLPARWFSVQKACIDREIRRLSPEERHSQEKKGLLPKRWNRWERDPRLWRRSIKYMVALLRYRRPDSGEYTFEQQLDLLDQHRSVINAFLKEQREHIAFLEYGTPKRIPRAVGLAQDQVKAALLADVEGLSHIEIADRLDVDFSGRSFELYRKIPAVTRMITAGRRILDRVLPETGWHEYAEQMKVEAERYRSLSKEEKVIEELAESMNWTVEKARSLYQSNPGFARFILDTSVRS